MGSQGESAEEYVDGSDFEGSGDELGDDSASGEDIVDERTCLECEESFKVEREAYRQRLAHEFTTWNTNACLQVLSISFLFYKGEAYQACRHVPRRPMLHR